MVALLVLMPRFLANARKWSTPGERPSPMTSMLCSPPGPDENVRNVLGVIVPVVGQDVEAGEPERPLHFRGVPGKYLRGGEEAVVVEGRRPVIGVQQAGKAVHVDAPVAVPIEPLDAEVPVLLGAEKMGFRHRDACGAGHQTVGVFDGADDGFVLTCATTFGRAPADAPLSFNNSSMTAPCSP
jgi:hypothetical protein